MYIHTHIDSFFLKKTEEGRGGEEGEEGEEREEGEEGKEAG